MNKVKKNITIVDVAEKAGVSKTTISRYLNGKFEFMSEESKRRIAQIIDELGYRPNNLARSLKSKKSRLIGVVVSDISSPFSSILSKGISDCCERYGYGVLITSTDDNPRKEREYILSMIDQRVEGIILNTTGQNNEFLEKISKVGIPIILADRPITLNLFDCVRTADAKYVRQTMQYLKENNYDKVALFIEALNNGTRLSRFNAYNEACHSLLNIEPEVYYFDHNKPEAAKELMMNFIGQAGSAKKAVFAANGVVLLHVVKALQALDLKFPKDIGICGLDNWDWTEIVSPGITVIEQPSYRVGRECVKRMMFRLHRNKNATPRLIELECKLIIRGSV